jgi:hypothetical protein
MQKDGALSNHAMLIFFFIYLPLRPSTIRFAILLAEDAFTRC